LLGLSGDIHKYTLPGGEFDKRKDRDALDTAIRELNE
jgi:hypothetical protein|tara:strand:+ start:11250 stop:11360 length:111 start_codon:yes stop_codon:yes gene_type:complete